ncbi:MAG: flippase [Patescibacteria group bacterium]|jgi:O-antigen/teichoic acid export membrane protein
MAASVAKNAFYLTAATIGQKIIAFFYFLFLANIFLKEQTGAYFLALSITTIFSVVADFGITPVIIREVAKHPEGAVSLVRRALGLKLPIIVLGMAGSVLAAELFGYSSEVKLLVLLASLVMAEDAISLLYFGVLRGLHVLRYESFGMVIGEIIICGLGSLSLLFYPSPILLILALVAGSLFNAIFSALQVVKQLGWKVLWPQLGGPETLKLFKTSIPFALAGGFSKMYSYVDYVLLSIIISTAAVGVYTVAYKMTYAFQFLPMAFVAAVYPGMSALVGKDTKKLSELFEKSIWYLLIIGVPIVFGIFAIAPDVVRLTGKEYLEAVPILRALIFVLIPLFLDFPIGSLLNAADRQTTKTAIMGITMIINVVLNAILIPKLGIIGAAYAAEVSFWFMFLAGLYFVPKIIPNPRWKYLSWLFVKIMVSGVLMAVATMYLRPTLGFIAVVPTAAIVYISLLFVTKSVKLEQLKELRGIILRKKYEEATPIDTRLSN